jgi:hypothetical protein
MLIIVVTAKNKNGSDFKKSTQRVDARANCAF